MPSLFLSCSDLAVRWPVSLSPCVSWPLCFFPLRWAWSGIGPPGPARGEGPGSPMRSVGFSPGPGKGPQGWGQQRGSKCLNLRSLPAPRSVSDPAQGGCVCPGTLLQPRVCLHREPYLWREGGERGAWGGVGSLEAEGWEGEQDGSTSSSLFRSPTSRWVPRRHPVFSTSASRPSACTPVTRTSVWPSPGSSSPSTTPRPASSAPRPSVREENGFLFHFYFFDFVGHALRLEGS